MMAARRPAYALATVLVLLGVTLFGVGALVTVASLESQLSRSHSEGVVAYYTAEAGMSDAVWRLNSNSTYKNALLNGTLNVTFSASNAPASGESYTVTMKTATEGAGYADVTVNASDAVGTFTAKRAIKNKVFLGSSGTSLGNNSLLAGGSLTITNGSATVQLVNSDIYAGGSVTINQATVNTGTGWIRTISTYQSNSSYVTTAGIQSTSNPPAPSALSIPAFDTAGAAASANVTYTATQFTNAISNGGSTVNFPGPITYVNGSVNLTSGAKNKTVNVTGLLVINGSFSVSSAAKNLIFNVNDPGNGKAGLVCTGGLSLNIGSWNINGILYAGGSIMVTGLPSFVVQGAVLGGGSVQLNAGGTFSLTNNSTRIAATLPSVASPQAFTIKHWEEEY